MQGTIETRVGLFVLAALGVFVYMGFQIGAFRFDRNNYNAYTMFVTDISGLSRKADVKIAGVKVGWVESITLLAEDTLQAQATLMVAKNYRIYANSSAHVRQDGLLGPKYVELMPGDSLTRQLRAGDELGRRGVDPVSIDEILQQFKKIAGNVEVITDSVKDAVGDMEGRRNLRETFENLHMTMQQMGVLSQALNRSFARNEENIDVFLSVGGDVKQMIKTLDTRVLPAFQEGIDRISSVVDRDFNRIAMRFQATGEALEEASLQARDGLRTVGSIAQKINDGEGLLGKLINEDETYKDLRVAIKGFKNYLTNLDRLEVVFDSHFESMQRPAETYLFEDSKGYFDVRIHPNQDHFYIVQLAASEKGFKTQSERFYTYRDQNRLEVNVNDITNLNNFVGIKRLSEEETRFDRYQMKVGLQIGKIFNNIALRFGIFENSAGVGVDVNMPFNTDFFRWTTTLEAFDLSGWNRLNDRRPHIKWCNKMYFARNLYFAFGADDFVSRRNASAFIGAGMRFGDENIKYLFSSLSGAGNVVTR